MSILVSVPASTSNLGAGFDCVGVAVDRKLQLAVSIDAARTTAVEIQRHGTLHGITLPPERDHLYVGFAAACQAAGQPVPTGLIFNATSDIPVARGLGSSAVAIVAGAV